MVVCYERMFYDQLSLWPVMCCMTVSEEMIVNRGCFDYKRRKESWMKGQQTCPLLYIYNVNSKLGHCNTKVPLAAALVHLWAYCTYSSHDVNDVMCERWPHHQGLCPLHFSNSGVGSFMSHKNQISVSAVRQDLRFFL